MFAAQVHSCGAILRYGVLEVTGSGEGLPLPRKFSIFHLEMAFSSANLLGIPALGVHLHSPATPSPKLTNVRKHLNLNAVTQIRKPLYHHSHWHYSNTESINLANWCILKATDDGQSSFTRDRERARRSLFRPFLLRWANISSRCSSLTLNFETSDYNTNTHRTHIMVYVKSAKLQCSAVSLNGSVDTCLHCNQWAAGSNPTWVFFPQWFEFQVLELETLKFEFWHSELKTWVGTKFEFPVLEL